MQDSRLDRFWTTKYELVHLGKLELELFDFNLTLCHKQTPTKFDFLCLQHGQMTDAVEIFKKKFPKAKSSKPIMTEDGRKPNGGAGHTFSESWTVGYIVKENLEINKLKAKAL